MATFCPERLDFLPGYAIIPEKEAIVVIREKIIAWLRDEQKKIAPMSPKKKWEYIWNYYKWWILGAVLLVGIVITGISDAQYQKKQVAKMPPASNLATIFYLETFTFNLNTLPVVFSIWFRYFVSNSMV